MILRISHILPLLLLWFCGVGGTRSFNEPSLTTDRTQYTLADTVHVLLVNNSSRAISIEQCCGRFVYAVECDAGRGWEEVAIAHRPCNDECLGNPLTLDPGKRLRDLLFVPRSGIVGARLPGRWRLRLTFVTERKHRSSEEVIYSSPFTVSY